MAGQVESCPVGYQSKDGVLFLDLPRRWCSIFRFTQNYIEGCNKNKV